MNDQTRENYNFCPKCGALMENGVCPECSGQRDEQGVYSSQNYPQEMPEQNYQPGSGYQTNMYGSGQSQQDPYGSYQNQQDPYGPYQNQQDPYGSYQNQQDPYGPYQNQQNQYGSYQNQQGPYQNQQNQYYGQQGPYQNQQDQYYGQQGSYQNQQNSYYGQQNYSPYNPYMKPKKDNKVWVTIGVVVAVLFLLGYIIFSFFYGYFIMKYASMDSSNPYVDEYDFEEEGSGIQDPYFSYDGEDAYGGDDYVPSPTDTYYYGPCNAINEDVDYSFVTKSYTNEDPDNDIDVVINYIELKGNSIPNIDQLNEAIETVALYYAEDFPKYSYYAEYGESYAVYTTTYVTYNDEDMISIVIDEYVVLDDEYHVDLYPINIDVKNGVVLDNGSLLEIDEAFAREFRERNDEQNGSIDYLDALSDEELAQVLRDRDAVIAYYTPLGMEVGMNYSDSVSSGWVTVTYKDYDKYLKKF
ncbi:proline-rich domain-containing protein [Lachnospiraceae bacterium JLR.KK008]